jgi:hypothetical protein
VIFAFVANIFAKGTETLPIPTVEELAKRFP